MHPPNLFAVKLMSFESLLKQWVKLFYGWFYHVFSDFPRFSVYRECKYVAVFIFGIFRANKVRRKFVVFIVCRRFTQQ